MNRFLIAEDADREDRWFLIHTRAPRFVAEIVDPDEIIEPIDECAVADEDYGLVGFVFFDGRPDRGDLEAVCADGFDALARYDDRAEADTARLAKKHHQAGRRRQRRADTEPGAN